MTAEHPKGRLGWPAEIDRLQIEMHCIDLMGIATLMSEMAEAKGGDGEAVAYLSGQIFDAQRTIRILLYGPSDGDRRRSKT